MTGKWRTLIDLRFLLSSIGFPLALWALSPDDSISLKLALPVLALLSILLVFSVQKAYQYYQRAENILPKLIRIVPDNMGVICLFEPSELYSHNALVSLFFNDEDYERLIGLGYVFNVQDDKNIQILITQWIPGQEEIKDKLENNNAQVLEKIIAKPNVNQAYFDISERIGGTHGD